MRKLYIDMKSKMSNNNELSAFVIGIKRYY